MKRILSGSLKHLAPPALLRLVSATSPSGILELVTDAGSLRLDVAAGRVKVPTPRELYEAGRVLRCTDGAFRFEPCALELEMSESLTLTAFSEAAQTSERFYESSFAVAVDRLLDGDIEQLSQAARPANIHVLPRAPLENPLDELLSDLEATAPGELLFTKVGVVAQDPRLWRGTLESGWRRRGWRLLMHATPSTVSLAELDVLVLHQQHPIEDADLESRWIDVVARATAADPKIPVIWVGRIGDTRWIERLVEAGVDFLMPAPGTRRSEVVARFAELLGIVVDRQLGLRQKMAEPDYPPAVCELVDTLMRGLDSDQAVGSLLQVAADDFLRGAVLMVERTAFRCRAGFGYPLNRGVTALPRGVGILERAMRHGEAIVGIDPSAAGARELARVLGTASLPRQTAVIPLGTGASIGGLLVADRQGEQLPDLGDMALLACCLGGIAMRPDVHARFELP